MTLFRLAVWGTTLVAAALQGEKGVDTTQVDGLAKRWGERWYVARATVKGVEQTAFAGRMKITEADSLLRFDGEAWTVSDKMKYGARMAMVCRKNRYLTPVEYSCDVMEAKGATVSFASTFADGKVTTTYGSKKTSKDIPADLVHSLAIMPLATCAVFEKDSALPLTYYDVFDNYGRVCSGDASKLRYDGTEELEIAGVKRKAHRIALDWESRKKHYWVSDDRELLQFVEGPSAPRFVLTDEKTGKAALEELRAKGR
jgi:hypothetical protein